MANYQLGPVIGQLGGGVEIVEQQITTDRNVSIPAGWGSGYAGFQGVTTSTGHITVLGLSMPAPIMGRPMHGFRRVDSGQSLAMQNVSGTLAFIRID